MSTIGVFDSGVGGASVTQAIQKAMPEHQVIYRDDKKNLPYGSKTKAELRKLVVPIIVDMAKQCDVIVIACNTVSTTLIDELREAVSIPLIAMEPMVKPAAEQTKSDVVAICATPTTLASSRYAWLVEHYAGHIQIIEPDCSTWSYMIEHNQVNEQLITESIEDVCARGADVIVLACTHYHWIEDLIKQVAAGRATVIQPEQSTILQLQRVLAQLD